jgi:hypothetical protein
MAEALQQVGEGDDESSSELSKLYFHLLGYLSKKNWHMY